MLDNIFDELQILERQYNTATPQYCFDKIRLLANALNITKEEKREKFNNFTDEKWDQYRTRKYELGSYMLRLIKSYCDRYDVYLQDQIREINGGNEIPNNTTTEVSSTVKKEPIPRSQSPELMDKNEESFSFSESFNQKETSEQQNGISRRRASYVKGKNVASDSFDDSSSFMSTSTDRSNSFTVRKRSTLRKSINIDGVETNYNDDNRYVPSNIYSDEELSRNNSVERRQSIPLTPNSDASFTRHVNNIQKSNTEDDVYIDLEAGDIVSISEFTGEYALGYNCRTKDSGLFPIYDIDSLNGFAIFYRIVEDGDEVSKNDVIFVVSEAENNLIIGYNITKGENGTFTMNQLKVLQFDSNNKPILDDGTQTQTQTPSQTQSQTQAQIQAQIQAQTTSSMPPPPIQQMSYDQNMNMNMNMNMNGNGNGDYNNYYMNGNNGNPVNYDGNNYNGNNYGNGGMVYTDQGNMNNYSYDEYGNYNGSYDNNMNMNNGYGSYDNYGNYDEYGNYNGKLMRAATRQFLDVRPSISSSNSVSSKKLRKKNITKTDHSTIKFTIKNLIEKEIEFNEKLKAVIDYVITPFEKKAETSNEVLNKIEITSIFKHFDDLYEFSNKLLKDLKKSYERYDESGPKGICEVYANNFLNKAFLDFSSNYESAMYAIDRIRNDPAKQYKYTKIESIFNEHKKEFHRSTFNDFHYNILHRFFSYRLELGRIQECIFEEDIFQEIEVEMEYLKIYGANMDKRQGENEQVHKFFKLKNKIMNYPVEFLSSHRKLLSEYDVTCNGRQFPKHIYLFSDCIMVVTSTKEAKKEGFKYDLENIIFFKDYEFTRKEEPGQKDCIKCVCSVSQKELDSHFKSNRKGRKLSRKSKPQSKINFFYFNKSYASKSVYNQYLLYKKQNSNSSSSSSLNSHTN
ncbi:hypothetical protein H8356DRAFT_1302781 [Neocallimastix lanati (nom. inval.)]|nr:hypothetical protein H8356DRAFT_1302781 [Neocallimastix sp. JGI-2020a]